MPHAVIASPTREHFDCGIPATLIPPRRVYRPLEATFMETEARDMLHSTFPDGAYPPSVSRYIRSISSTVEPFTSDMCDDPAIKSVLSCRNRKADVSTLSSISSNGCVSLRQGAGYQEPGEVEIDMPRTNPREPFMVGSDHTEQFTTRFVPRTMPSDFELMNAPALLPSSSGRVKLSANPCVRNEIDLSMLVSIASDQRCDDVKDTTTRTVSNAGHKRKASHSVSWDPSNQTTKRTKLTSEDNIRAVVGNTTASHDELKDTVSLCDQSYKDDPPAINDVVSLSALGFCEVEVGTVWTHFEPRAAKPCGHWATLAYSDENECGILRNQAEGLEIPRISKVLRLAHAFKLSKAIIFPASCLPQSESVKGTSTRC